MGIAAYKQTIKATAKPKDIEHRVFQQVTARLEAYKENQGFMSITSDMKDALWENQRLWHTLMLDLVSPDNPLPKDLRAQLISLSAFVDRHSAEVLSGKETVGPLIDINRAIMGGLKASPAAQ